MAELDPHVRTYYERGTEVERLEGGAAAGPLELERTKELILRDLPDAPPGGRLRILDIGGGPGVYAAWLAGLGHEVRLIDPVPLHLEQAVAADGRIDATPGDARHLDVPDGSVDVVLLLGPLYHLVEADDRRDALAEARRVLRPGGRVFAAAISRYAALLDLLVRLDRLHEPEVMAVAREAARSGRFAGARAGLFTNAYFHRPSELRAEVEAAGYVGAAVYNIEGPGFVVPDLPERWEDPARRQALLEAARLVESDPEMLAAASHLLAVARRPNDPSGGAAR